MLDNLRNKAKRIVVGLMSGTSLDGVDAAVVELSGPGLYPEMRLLHYVSVQTRIHPFLASKSGGYGNTAG
ncbi:hypothetical protein B1222_14345 [Paenibacillus larvae subsp. pulvifaciens]|uniref:anhydro-N-acetylmuramic acid kinase n=1 Tax=Paenibacillus larvae TaxID=1464 RepID=UPI00098F6B57|nr:anhydro-N-acetylmuramic acid kinase [Paenibacillus larvae]AQT85314.1 hypothetical protein B1222_14345 [Paenibacillus larvae subsp. pulvifaciens]AQZ47319.1 hypothetical protein B5S25_12715 [Paenibacillus larvae subsp. pulvifaciens]MBH0343170.1 hypothetical protein [Paenibacillus larvae]MCY7519677.1 anhydro-N-acetylmuramic acid kinase [Paenibacillus larvae]MCY9501242.1 anhydro-N-acetylmuramic acid kinase [Paenibacillus larvae]